MRSTAEQYYDIWKGNMKASAPVASLRGTVQRTSPIDTKRSELAYTITANTTGITTYQRHKVQTKTSTSVFGDGRISTHADPTGGQRTGRVSWRTYIEDGRTCFGMYVTSCR